MERTAYYVRKNGAESDKYLKVSQNGQFGTRYSLTDDPYAKTIFDTVEAARKNAMTYIIQHQKCKATELSIVEIAITERALDIQTLVPSEYIISPLVWGKEAKDVLEDDAFLAKCFMRQFKAAPKSFDRELLGDDYAEIRCYNIVW